MANQAVNGFIVPAWRDPNAPPPGDVPHPVATFTEPLVLSNADADFFYFQYQTQF